MNFSSSSAVEMVPIDSIHILNSRVRDKYKFSQIVSNIAILGLKKPITLRKKECKDGKKCYDLICGQGRLEAYIALGQKEIPAVIVQATQEDCYLMSLIENLARRHQTTLELVYEIGALEDRGYSPNEIATKTDLRPEYVKGIVRLLRQGEVRLLEAVEKGRVPISVAVKIAVSDDAEIQQSLREAYEDQTLRGQALLEVRKLIEQRKSKGKGPHSERRFTRNKDFSKSLLKAYKNETERQKVMLRKANVSEDQLHFIVAALRQLFQDENFTTLLRAESLDMMPKNLFSLLEIQGDKSE